ncbi:MAG: hypothetical protein OXK77_03460 [Gemmatimonadota bacterium]|nr:hypothetical protein [Gemmatimonadota bacterium]MDE2864517.1 hypothetical protein [Gemmatimonadota bacterium]
MTGLPITVAEAMALVAKVTVVLSIALVLAWFARRGSARTLHLLWTTTFAVLLALPGLSLLGPSWALPVLPARTAAIEDHLPEYAASDLSAMTALPGAVRQPQSVNPPPTRGLPPAAQADGPIPLTPAVGVFLIWALGCAAGLVSLATAALRFRRLVRGATPLQDPDWIRSTDRLRHRLRVRADARILSSVQVPTPMTGGPLKPVILLPASARNWTSGRREAVVSHELVHVRRRDALWRLVGGTVVALYWFHPLIWLASRLAAAARERSCDEEVLALGVRPSAYARHLFSLASEIVPGPTVLSLPVVQRPHLESRIMSILKPHRPRFSQIRTSAALALIGVAGIVAACAGPVRMDPAESPAPPVEIAVLAESPTDTPAPAALQAPAPAPPSERAPSEPTTTGPIAAAPALPEARGLQEFECRSGSFTGIRRDGESMTVQLSEDGMLLCMRTSGEVVMNEDGTAVASMDSGSWLVLESEADRLHRMVITSGPDGLEHEWSIDGRSQPFDDEARDWRNLMLTVLGGSRAAWEVRSRAASLRRQIGSHERHVASLHRQIGSHERHVASLRRQTGSHERHVAGLRRQIGSHERHDAGLQRAIEGYERGVAALRSGMARMERWLREESGNDVREQMADIQIELERAERAVQSIRQAIEAYDLDQRVGEITQEIEEYDLDGKMGEIEARIEGYDLDGRISEIEALIEQYDLDGKIRELEEQIEEWDGDRRADEIERSIQDEIAALRRLVQAAERRR